VTDVDELVATIPRGARGELRIRRRTYRGSPPFVDVRHYFPGDNALLPGRGITLRVGELRRVIEALAKVAPPAESSAAPKPARPHAPGQRSVAAAQHGEPFTSAEQKALEEDEALF
jgi:hypothetical protein